MVSDPPMIRTARLFLRPPVQEDLSAWAAFLADAEAMRFLGGAQPREIAWRSLAVVAGSWALKGFGMFSVLERETGRWIGRIGPWQPEGWSGPEIGYALARHAWGKGYALEAAAASIDWALETLGWPEFIHHIAPENAASAALAARLGSTYRGPGRLPPPWDKERIDFWGQTAAQWRQRRGGAG